jgi:HEPN/Toprim N-terminal domain 1
MGSMIHLAVGRLEIDWGKNNGFTDHSPLFQISDVAEVPYYYVAEGQEMYTDASGEDRYILEAELKEGMSKPLGLVVDRINLLGHTRAVCEKEFEFLAGFNASETGKFGFDELKRSLAEIDVNSISADYGEMGDDFGKFFRRQIFNRLGLQHTASNPRYVQYDAAEAMENLSAYTILQLLAENPAARGLPVNWQFADVENGGWAKREFFVRKLEPAKRFLIVTEGSSDAKIIKHAFELLRPHIADFFDFVDMEEGYPFTGTGNLFRFLQGLISISIQNSVIVIYDNDAEGHGNFVRSCALNVPNNMRILKLPDDSSFVDFDTVGPSGRSKQDINGRAAAIECYLDLGQKPEVRWTGFNGLADRYQGELLNKTLYMKDFLDQRLRLENYDYTKINNVLDVIVNACIEMREAVALEHFDGEQSE